MKTVLSKAMVGSVRAAPPRALRHFAAASEQLAKCLQGEIKHEDENYKQSKEIAAFLKSSPFKFVEDDGDVNMMLTREVGGNTVKIEWQLSSPFDPDADMEGGEAEQQATDISVTVESKANGSGLMFYCSTQPGEDHRYVIGNVRAFANAEERDSASAFNGPEFDDLDDKLQEAFDEYLAEVGMSVEVCDFVDAMALDKEERDYIRWLKTAKSFVE